MTKAIRSLVVIVGAALAVTAAGCGASSGTVSSATTPASTSAAAPSPTLTGGSHGDRRAVLATVNGYYAALASHQGGRACGYLTAAEQRHIAAQISARTSHFGHTCVQILSGIGLLLSGQVHVVSGSVGQSSARLVIQGKSRGTMTLMTSSGHWLISATS